MSQDIGGDIWKRTKGRVQEGWEQTKGRTQQVTKGWMSGGIDPIDEEDESMLKESVPGEEGIRTESNIGNSMYQGQYRGAHPDFNAMMGTPANDATTKTGENVQQEQVQQPKHSTIDEHIVVAMRSAPIGCGGRIPRTKDIHEKTQSWKYKYTIKATPQQLAEISRRQGLEEENCIALQIPHRILYIRGMEKRLMEKKLEFLGGASHQTWNRGLHERHFLSKNPELYNELQKAAEHSRFIIGEMIIKKVQNTFPWMVACEVAGTHLEDGVGDHVCSFTINEGQTKQEKLELELSAQEIKFDLEDDKSFVMPFTNAVLNDIFILEPEMGFLNTKKDFGKSLYNRIMKKGFVGAARFLKLDEQNSLERHKGMIPMNRKECDKFREVIRQMRTKAFEQKNMCIYVRRVDNTKLPATICKLDKEEELGKGFCAPDDEKGMITIWTEMKYHIITPDGGMKLLAM